MAGMQSMKNPNMIQMQRDGSNMDMNGMNSLNWLLGMLPAFIPPVGRS